MAALIELKDVSFTYPSGLKVLDGASLQIAEGELLGIIGPNGGGKSTLLKLILGLLKPSSGTVRVADKPPQSLSGFFGYVPQHIEFIRDFPITVKECIAMGRMGNARFIGGYSAEDWQAVDAIMRDMDITRLAPLSIQQLSGGELQRVLIARALVGEPKVLALDEPTSSLDPEGERCIFHQLQALKPSMTILVVSHDVGFVSHAIERVACVNYKIECHQTSDLSGSMMQDLYTGSVHAVDHGHSHHHQESKS